ncbi:hypothetical protein [Vulcanisaeta sp. JCM 16159]|uniref:hypothetical protein n=1 Tax=Vulcanisaeta sp. JCM 16159 TaxID=1295371 RepID=UPI001FB35543|nr:hypothetical protein [Vulcanisaeta sp. JCM 16159]
MVNEVNTIGIKVLNWLLLLSISNNERNNVTITNVRTLKQSMEEVVINVELELELPEDRQ